MARKADECTHDHLLYTTQIKMLEIPKHIINTSHNHHRNLRAIIYTHTHAATVHIAHTLFAATQSHPILNPTNFLTLLALCLSLISISTKL